MSAKSGAMKFEDLKVIRSNSHLLAPNRTLNVSAKRPLDLELSIIIFSRRDSFPAWKVSLPMENVCYNSGHEGGDPPTMVQR